MRTRRGANTIRAFGARVWAVALAVSMVGCGSTEPRPTAASASPAAPAPVTRSAPSSELHGPPFPVASATNLGRLGTLTARQQSLLESQGFFLAAQPPRPQTPPNAAEAVAAQRATHLFHVYERNDYIQFPSYVTVDLAIDATHAYFGALLREIEAAHLVPRLRAAIVAFLAEAGRMRAAARAANARETALRIETFWAVALSLLERAAPGDAPEREVVAQSDPDAAPPAPVTPPAATPIPAAVRRQTSAIVTDVIAARAEQTTSVSRAPVDMSQMRPRGHYTRNGVLMRWFRAMSWLGMVAFPVEGEHADVAGAAALARSTMGSQEAAQSLETLVALTAFFVGGPDTSGLVEARARLTRIVPGAAQARLDTLVTPDVLARYAASLAELPPPRIASGAAGGARQIRVAGRRAFEDAFAMQMLIAAVTQGEAPPRDAIPVVFGGVGAAAVLGSAEARGIAIDVLPARRAELGAAIDRGRAHIASIEPTRWDGDAYHGTIHALRSLFEPLGESAPAIMRTAAWRTRALQSFASGWAELRHDTILYGEQLGAECDAPDYEPPDAWVEPVPELYGRLAAMVRALDARLRAAGIPLDAARTDQAPYATPLAEKTRIAISLLDFLRECAELELRGVPFDRDRLTRLTLIGGEVEWLMIALANTDLLSERDRDMAVVADVFTWRPTSEAVEVGIAHPDLVYALIPTPRGPVVARGAVMSYREMMQPISNRLTDEAWRALIAAGNAPERPGWVRALHAEPVPAIALVGEGVSRCGPSSGSVLDL